jgi:hypothetical protein
MKKVVLFTIIIILIIYKYYSMLKYSMVNKFLFRNYFSYKLV